MDDGTLHRLFTAGWRWMWYYSGTARRQVRSLARPRILMYHVIGDGDVSPAQFEWHLRFVRRHLEPVSLATLLDRIQDGSTSGHEAVITFDDGVRNHFTTAWPLLLKHRVPATFFVCPGLIGSGKWLWRTELRMRLETLDESRRTALVREAGCAERDVEPIMQWTKGLRPDDREAFERAVKVLTPHFRPDPQQVGDHAPLSWEQIRTLDPALISIGSHTCTHPMLTTLSAEALEREMRESRAALEQALDRKADLFSYPNGANNPVVVAAARRHYRCALTTRVACVETGDDPYLLPRIPAGGSRAVFSRRMHRPTA